MAKKHKSDQGDAVDPKSPVIDLEAEEVKEIESEAVATAEPPPADEESASPPPPPSPTPAKKKSGSSAKLWGGVALVALAALGGAWLYKDYGARFWPTDEMTAMASRLATLESENKTLGDQLRGLGAAVDEIKAGGSEVSDALKTAQAASQTAVQNSGVAQETARALAEKLSAADARIAATQKAVDALKAAIAAAPSGGATQGSVIDVAALDELRARLETVEKDLAELKAKGPAPGAEVATLLSQTLADLKAKIAAGAPYAQELQRIANLVPAASGLETLRATADNGVATAQMLADEAKVLAEKLAPPAAEAPAGGDGSYWDSLLGMLGGVVKVRNIGETDWRDVAGKAGEAVLSGNLREALELAAGEGEMPNELRVWRDRVQARLNADVAIEEVSSAVLRQIAAIGGTP
jgi:hypothetical protein